MPASKGGKTKVLYATFERIPSTLGMSCWIAEEIKELARHFELDVLSLKSENLSHVERFHGVRLLRVPVGTGSFRAQVKAFQRALNRQIDSEDYRLCQFTSLWEGMVLASRKKAEGFKLIYEVHSLPSVDFKVVHPKDAHAVEQSYSLKQQEERCLSLADGVLAGSKLLKEHLARRGVPVKRITLLLPGIDLTPFNQVDEILPQPGTVLYLGDLNPWQGVPSLLAALAELPRQFPVRLLLVASKQDPYFKEVQGKIQMLGLGNKVESIDLLHLENLPALVARANVCVAPLANHEHNQLAAPIPRKVLVYMACRRPVVASDQPAIREVVENGVHGLLYPPGDFRALAELLKKLLLNQDLATRMGKQARLHLEQSFDLAGSLERLLTVYRRLIGEPVSEVQPQAEDDTWPSIPPKRRTTAKTPKEPATRPVPPLVHGEKAQFPEDTEPVRQNGAGGGEIIFYSAEQEDTAPRCPPNDSNHWRVMELRQVSISKSGSTSNGSEFVSDSDIKMVSPEDTEGPDGSYTGSKPGKKR